MSHDEIEKLYGFDIPVYVGIDPGLTGGLAILAKDVPDGDNKRVAVYSCPLPTISIGKGRGKTEIDINRLAQIIGYPNKYLGVSEVVETWVKVVAIERVASMPKQGVAGVFTFGRTYGELLGMLKTLRIPFDRPTPQTWKKAILSGTSKDKIAAINYVKASHPNLCLLASKRCKKPHDGMADAVCLAEYASRLDSIF